MMHHYHQHHYGPGGYLMTETNDPVITGTSEWVYAVPPRTDAKVQLLTIGAIQTTGNWYGKYGEFFVAYAPLPKRNKEIERKLGVLQNG
jgi:hypothetical protein